MLADVYTPVGIYMRLRDRFRDTVLLESTDHHAVENSYSFICVNAIGGIEITDRNSMEFKFPKRNTERLTIKKATDVPALLGDFLQRFEIAEKDTREAGFAQGLFGYTSYDAVQFFDKIELSSAEGRRSSYVQDISRIPLIRYRLYQYVIVINHFKDELTLCENRIEGLESDPAMLESLIRSKDVPAYPFRLHGEGESNMTDEQYISIVRKGIEHCHRGDVFQVVLSRRFEQGFTGDEFNVYRALRSINPSPYLFYFDYGDYRLMGSSPESQLIVQNGQAIIHPIAGTYKRSGDDEIDKLATERLLSDPKESAEHVMLVDLARNDLSRICDDVTVAYFKKVQFYSHVIHLVSEVIGNVKEKGQPFEWLARTFPAGTLSGAPKFSAMELINILEPTTRGFYGGAIGFIGFDGSCNHAIMIRTFLSKQNKLVRQAGAGVVAASVPENELKEVDNKLNALLVAMKMAENIY